MGAELPDSPAPPAAAGDLVPGGRVAGYVLDRQIGRGGMAVVYVAHDERLGRRVALKVLTPALAADDAFRQRFLRESRAAAAIDHPHVIPVFDAGEADDVLFIAMRYVEAGDVHSMVRASGPVTPARAAAILSPVASALDAAHRGGLVHRDVKPANMLLDVQPGRPDHVYLSDFGLAKASQAPSELTGSGQFLGTPVYSAPEQITERKLDGRADQYSLACSAVELLTGAPPFPRERPMAAIWAHMSAPPPSLSARRPGLPHAVDPVVARALAKDPAGRYASCGEFAEALRAALGLPPYHAAGQADPPDGRPAAARPALSVVPPAPAAGPAPADDEEATREAAQPAWPAGRPAGQGRPARLPPEPLVWRGPPAGQQRGRARDRARGWTSISLVWRGGAPGQAAGLARSRLRLAAAAVAVALALAAAVAGIVVAVGR